MPRARSPSPPVIDIFDDDDEGWQDMPVVLEDKLRGGLDEEDQRRYHYKPQAEKEKISGSGANGLNSMGSKGVGNATGKTLDTDEYGYRWRSNPMDSQSINSADSNSSAAYHDFSTESAYTRLRHVEEDWDEGDEIQRASRILFADSDGGGFDGLAPDDRKAITPLSQMQQTKNLLSESQRIAYVGLCALIIQTQTQKQKQADGTTKVTTTTTETIKRGKDGKSMVKKEFKEAVKSMELWAMKIMGRLYYHIELETQEQRMIESLYDHGVQPADLVPALMTTKEVPNPEYTGSYSYDTTEAADSTDTGTSVPSDPSDPTSATNLIDLTSPKPEPDEPETKPKPVPKTIPLSLRYTLLTDLFLILIADSVYDSRSRSLLFRVGKELGVPWWDSVVFEGRVVEGVGVWEDTAEEGLQQNKEHVDKQVKALRNRRIALLGLATLGGGLVIGLSAGLLAPVIGVGLGTAFGTIGITGASSFLAGAGGAAVITTGGVLTGAGIAGRGMNRRTQVVRVFDVLPLHRNGRVGCVVSVPGFLNGPLDDPRLPFSVLDPVVGDVFSVLWEPEMIRETGSALKILTGEVLSQIGQTVLQATVMATLMTALQWPIILTKLGYLIDNPWSNALDRARAAGLVLASVLRERQLGVRPVTLIGFSLGARVIFYALLDLAKTESYGIVQDVFLLGGTISVSQTLWEQTRSVVGGRYVNAYARNDWVLNYLFRASSNVNTVAGLRPIQGVQGLENIDVTDKIAGHMSYRVYMPVILEELGFRVTERWFDEVEEPDFEGDRVVITEEEEKAQKKGWFGRKSTTRNMSARTKAGVQRPPSYASWADKKKDGLDAKRTSIESDDLPPREGTPTGKGPGSGTATPTRTGSPAPMEESRSSTPTPNIIPLAGFDFAAIKAELEGTKEQAGGLELFTDTKGTSELVPKVEAPRIGGIPPPPLRLDEVGEEDQEDDNDDDYAPPTPPSKSPNAAHFSFRNGPRVHLLVRILPPISVLVL
ncbi:hypothetical protein BDP27DRAFT_1413730 [Rhodocollybia butyracea]|uniref:DUF726-domain-containing protein n=1 Tax=Rhodocollybia butyracea TaxID=206335 RepID=A0A9P5Q8M5_9AGAR|nr:hypothetical protein BDP27DRAFT_1413730 [Rhodocollybia butyracea]